MCTWVQILTSNTVLVKTAGNSTKSTIDVTKLDPDRGDVCGGGGERNPGHETEQELDLF